MQKNKRLDENNQLNIIQLVNDYIQRSEIIFDRTFKPIDVSFDLSGRAAGMYKVVRGVGQIRFNPDHFEQYPEENWNETIPHEVAHYITDQVFGMRNIRPHGKQWKALMLQFGVEPKRTFSYSLEGIPNRMHKRHPYRCICSQFEITTRRHNTIQNGRADYLCKQCGQKIEYVNNIMDMA